MHALASQTVDVLLAFILMIGGVIGAQLGASMGQAMRGEQLRALLGLLVLAVGVRFAVNLVVSPDTLYAITVVGAVRCVRASSSRSPRCWLRCRPRAEAHRRRPVDRRRLDHVELRTAPGSRCSASSSATR